MVEFPQRGVQGGGTGQVVERVHGLAPAGSGQPFGVLGDEPCPGRDDQDVVPQQRAVLEEHPVLVDVHVVDGAAVVADRPVQLVRPGAHELVRRRQPERQEQQTRLVDVVVVLVDDGDLDVGTEHPPQAVRRQRATGARAKDHDMFAHAAMFVGAPGGRLRLSSRRRGLEVPR